MARLPVTHREPAFDYCLGELGSQHGALIPEEIVLECQMNEASYCNFQGRYAFWISSIYVNTRFSGYNL